MKYMMKNLKKSKFKRSLKYISGILIVNKEYGLPDTYAPGEKC